MGMELGDKWRNRNEEAGRILYDRYTYVGNEPLAPWWHPALAFAIILMVALVYVHFSQ